MNFGLGSSSYTEDHYKNILALHIHCFFLVSGSENAYHVSYGQQWDYMGFQSSVCSKNIHKKVSGAVPFKWRGQEERQKPSSTIFYPCVHTDSVLVKKKRTRRKQDSNKTTVSQKSSHFYPHFLGHHFSPQFKNWQIHCENECKTFRTQKCNKRSSIHVI